MKDLRQLEKLREEIYTSINLINQGENKSLKTLKAKINAFNTLYSQITNKKSEISLNEKLNLISLNINCSFHIPFTVLNLMLVCSI